jgi:protein-disulfide isomerase
VSKKAWIIFAAVCIVLLGGLVYLSSKDKVDVGSIDVSKVQAASAQSGNIADQVFGKRDSKVVLIEYGDFQCPGCGSAHPNIKAVTDKYREQIAFVFRNFPLASIHPNARAAAAAAEAAGLQGRYWDMHDMLYENQSDWGSLGAEERTVFFTEYAKDLQLNLGTFKTDLAGSNVNQKISFDQALGKKANVTATPALFLNGKVIEQETWQDKAKLDAAFVDALKANNIALPAPVAE